MELRGLFHLPILIALILSVTYQVYGQEGEEIISTTSSPEAADGAITESTLGDDYGDDGATAKAVRKCYCEATEALHEGECKEHPLLVQEVMSSSYEFNVTIKDMVCPQDEAPTTIQDTFIQQFAGGFMYVQSAGLYLSVDEYCLEYLDEGHLAMVIKVCLPAPSLPLCCDVSEETSVTENDSGPGSVVCRNDTQGSTAMAPITSPLVYIHGLPLLWNETMYHVSPLPKCGPDYDLISVTLTGSVRAGLSYNVSVPKLDWMSPLETPVTMTSGDYCIEQQQHRAEDIHIAHFCYQDPLAAHNDICRGKSCVRKCCPAYQSWNAEVGCFPDEQAVPWMPDMYNSETAQPTNESLLPMAVVHGFPICRASAFYVLNASDPFTLMNDGRLFVLSDGISYPASEYCIDNSLTVGNSSELAISHIVLVCFPEVEENHCVWQTIVQMVALALSCVFIVATLFVYMSVPEIFRRLSSKCVVSQSFALLMSFLSLIVLQSLRTGERTVFCIATGLVFYYSTLASFFWLNVMCFDMYFTIKSFVPVNECTGGGQSSSNRLWYLRYSLYGWGLPLAFVVAVCVCDNLPFDISNYNIIRSNIFTACHIPNEDMLARWVYMYIPMVLLLVVNAVLFVLVAVNLVQRRKEMASVLQNSESQARQGGKQANCDAGNSNAKESALLCLKLFMVMGVTWITDIISFAEGNACYVWLATDIINCLRGFFIFLIFVCKRDVIKKFKTTWRPHYSPLLTRCCNQSTGWGLRKRSPPGEDGGKRDTATSIASSFWSSRKTSVTSLSFFSIGAKRKTSTASIPETHKMAPVQESAVEQDTNGDVKF